MLSAFLTESPTVLADFTFDGLNTAAVVVFGIIALVLGAVECFAGYKIMRPLVAIWGFFAGALLGTVIGIAAESLAIGTVLVLIFGGALVFLAIKYEKAGIGIQVGFLVIAAIYLVIARIMDVTVGAWWLPLMISLIFAVPCGFLATKFTKPFVVVSSAFGGAGIMFVSASIMILEKLSPNFVLMMIFLIPIALTGARRAECQGKEISRYAGCV